jgi:hypothetical protein
MKAISTEMAGTFGKTAWKLNPEAVVSVQIEKEKMPGTSGKAVEGELLILVTGTGQQLNP